jgi:hypothetical protein
LGHGTKVRELYVFAVLDIADWARHAAAGVAVVIASLQWA